MMSNQEAQMKEAEKLRGIIALVERANLVILVLGDKKAALGRDIQESIVSALKLNLELVEAADE